MRVSKSTITMYLGRGMPERNSGDLDLAICETWRRDYAAPTKSGSYKARRRAATTVTQAGSRGEFDRGYVAARADLRESLPVLIAVQGNGKTREGRIRMFLEIDAWLGRFASLNGNQYDAAELPAIDRSDCSDEIQALAKKIQREVDADFAKLKAVTL
jgi:hypothetical protein